VKDFGLIGSSLSLRSLARCGSSFSLRGCVRIGKTVSLLGFSKMGASLSLRSMARLGSALSVLDYTHFGSTLSVRSSAKVGGDFYVTGKLEFSTNTYIQETTSPSPALETYFSGNRVMSLSTTGGTLHGTWMADTVVEISDRRLKTNIKEIGDTMEQNRNVLETSKEKTLGGESPSPSRTDGKLQEKAAEKPLSWVLRQLRPVSYNFKQGNDAKNMRFGFIAQEMEKVLPQVVRELPRKGETGKDVKKGIVYPDLIAVLTAMMREFGTQLKAVQTRVGDAEAELDRLDREEPMDFADP